MIELMKEFGLDPQRTSSTRGGEFHSSCPACGGNDRFMCWPKTGRYWCRQCDISGDATQFCRDFLKLSFQEARNKAGASNSTFFPYHRSSFPAYPSSSWKDKAIVFIENAHRRLIIDQTALGLVRARGLTIETIKQYQIGWHPVSTFSSRTEWGLEQKLENGKEKKLFLPRGIVIPTFENEKLRKIKIRKSDRKEGDRFGKYYIVPGSADSMYMLSNTTHSVIIIVEAELDAMLVVQEAGNICSCLALGGAQKRPDQQLHHWLMNRELILFALDYDESGKNEYDWWQTTYPHLEPWPVPEEKSPGDYFIKNGDLSKWVSSGINLFVHRNGNS